MAWHGSVPTPMPVGSVSFLDPTCIVEKVEGGHRGSREAKCKPCPESEKGEAWQSGGGGGAVSRHGTGIQKANGTGASTMNASARMALDWISSCWLAGCSDRSPPQHQDALFQRQMVLAIHTFAHDSQAQGPEEFVGAYSDRCANAGGGDSLVSVAWAIRHR
ncbi:hypothetical protein BP6252_02588 [Coleophoma cylindrospora]|uniref:Uncharacterized protein n=1 Tax=Coleophoma cylindrospora TaxID=1849047 RepID=A0A3D8SGW5_9HELO|nr:hypothetical protein BP6252_02588 [Coleophoma cylindrospora]